jgi:hypothetical protein
MSTTVPRGDHHGRTLSCFGSVEQVAPHDSASGRCAQRLKVRLASLATQLGYVSLDWPGSSARAAGNRLGECE